MTTFPEKSCMNIENTVRVQLKYALVPFSKGRCIESKDLQQKHVNFQL